MSTQPREWPNQASYVRDDGAILVRQMIIKLEQITKNQVNEEEKMESIAADVVSDLNLLLRAFEREGARTDPQSELKNRVDQVNSIFSLVSA